MVSGLVNEANQGWSQSTLGTTSHALWAFADIRNGAGSYANGFAVSDAPPVVLCVGVM